MGRDSLVPNQAAPTALATAILIAGGRLFSEVVDQEVQVLAIVDKEQAQSWLDRAGK
jgi:hypothetical protein